MFDCDEAFRKLNAYLKLEWQINCLEGKLNDVINSLENAEVFSKSEFLIDDERIDGNVISNLKKDLIDYKSYLISNCKGVAIAHKDRLIDEIESNGITIIWS